MSDNPMRLTATFGDDDAAERTRQTLQQAQDWIFANHDEERYVRDYLESHDETHDVTFSSFWVPSGKIERSAESIRFECVGSPGDDWPDDLVVWLGKCGAARVHGTLTISGTGDVIDIDESYG